MSTVAHKVAEVVHQRPGLTREELRAALGTDVDRALRRLERLRYVRRIRSGRSVPAIIRSKCRGTEIQQPNISRRKRLIGYSFARRIAPAKCVAAAAVTAPRGRPILVRLESTDELYALGLGDCFAVGGEDHPCVTDAQSDEINALIDQAARAAGP